MNSIYSNCKPRPILDPYRPLINHDYTYTSYNLLIPALRLAPTIRTIRTTVIVVVLFFDLGILVIIILARVGNLVLEDLDELVEDDGEDGADCWSGPIDPVLLVEDAGDDTGPKTARGIERATGVVNTDELGDEKR